MFATTPNPQSTGQGGHYRLGRGPGRPKSTQASRPNPSQDRKIQTSNQGNQCQPKLLSLSFDPTPNIRIIQFGKHAPLFQNETVCCFYLLVSGKVTAQSILSLSSLSLTRLTSPSRFPFSRGPLSQLFTLSQFLITCESLFLFLSCFLSRPHFSP